MKLLNLANIRFNRRRTQYLYQSWFSPVLYPGNKLLKMKNIVIYWHSLPTTFNRTCYNKTSRSLQTLLFLEGTWGHLGTHTKCNFPSEILRNLGGGVGTLVSYIYGVNSCQWKAIWPTLNLKELQFLIAILSFLAYTYNPFCKTVPTGHKLYTTWFKAISSGYSFLPTMTKPSHIKFFHYTKQKLLFFFNVALSSLSYNTQKTNKTNTHKT